MKKNSVTLRLEQFESKDGPSIVGPAVSPAAPPVADQALVRYAPPPEGADAIGPSATPQAAAGGSLPAPSAAQSVPPVVVYGLSPRPLPPEAIDAIAVLHKSLVPEDGTHNIIALLVAVAHHSGGQAPPSNMLGPDALIPQQPRSLEHNPESKSFKDELRIFLLTPWALQLEETQTGKTPSFNRACRHFQEIKDLGFNFHLPEDSREFHQDRSVVTRLFRTVFNKSASEPLELFLRRPSRETSKAKNLWIIGLTEPEGWRAWQETRTYLKKNDPNYHRYEHFVNAIRPGRGAEPPSGQATNGGLPA